MAERKTRKDFNTEKEWLLHQQATLKARIAEIQQKENAKKRKNDTREKIVLGGAVKALLKQRKQEYLRPIFDEIYAQASEKDKKLITEMYERDYK